MKLSIYTLYTIFISILGGIFYLSITLQGPLMLNGNVSWLLMGAERILDGKLMSEDFFEGNPPLCILVYLPFVLLSKITGFPIAMVTYLGALSLSALSLFFTWHVLRKIKSIDVAERMVVILAYSFCLTLMQGPSFADKEHMILIGFIPFILFQYAYNIEIKFNILITIAIMVLGVVSILIKPHFGLFPTLMIAHRLYKQRSFHGLLAPDFIGLSIGCLLYAICLLTILSDYTFNVLPMTMKDYVLSTFFSSNLRFGTFCLFALIMTALFDEASYTIGPHKKKLLRFFYIASAACFVAFFFQMKGFDTHLVPALTLYIIGASLSLFFRFDKLFPSKKYCSLLFVFAIVSFGIGVLIPPNFSFMTKDKIKEFPVAKYLDRYCSKPCSFYVFTDTLEIFIPTALQGNHVYASRLSFQWQIPVILEKKKYNPETQYYIDGVESQNLLMHMVEDDIIKKQPDIIFIDDTLLDAKDYTFDYRKFFSDGPGLQKELSHSYRLSPPLTFDINDYGSFGPKPLLKKFSAYKRIDDAPPTK